MKSENLAAKKRTFRRKGVILHFACCGDKVQFPDAKKHTFRRKGVILPTACCGEKVHIPKETCDFACCCLLAVAKCGFWAFLSWMKSENLTAKQRTFQEKRAILLLAWCGEKVHFPGAKKCTFQRKRVISPTACCGEKVHIPKETCDFACCCLLACC